MEDIWKICGKMEYIYGRLVQHKAFKENSSSRLTHSFVRVSRKRSCSRFEKSDFISLWKTNAAPIEKQNRKQSIANGKFQSAFCFWTIIVNSRDISISRQQCIVRRRSAPKLNSNADFLEKEAFSIDYSLRSCTKERNVQLEMHKL